MPQLVKGGKWVFGWTIVDNGGRLSIPPEAWTEYGFRIGQTVIFVRGSRKSGGFALSTPELWPSAFGDWTSSTRVYGIGHIADDGRVALLDNVGIVPGTRLLVVRGSGNALGFIVKGPICEEALRHLELETFI